MKFKSEDMEKIRQVCLENKIVPITGNFPLRDLVGEGHLEIYEGGLAFGQKGDTIECEYLSPEAILSLRDLSNGRKTSSKGSHDLIKAGFASYGKGAPRLSWKANASVYTLGANSNSLDACIRENKIARTGRLIGIAGMILQDVSNKLPLAPTIFESVATAGKHASELGIGTWQAYRRTLLHLEKNDGVLSDKARKTIGGYYCGDKGMNLALRTYEQAKK